MFDTKYLSSRPYGFFKENLLSFFPSVAMATRVSKESAYFFCNNEKCQPKEHNCEVLSKLA
jgi:hypothetical protein